jgi:hypothetical protein
MLVDKYNNLFLVAQTNSPAGMATAGAHQTSNGGGSLDAFLVKILNGLSVGANLGSPLCAGAPVSVPYAAGDTIYTGNVYTVQLSDSSGSFSTAVAIGTLSTTNRTGSIAAIIPASMPYGTGYRVRVVSSSPADTGTINGNSVTIVIPPAQPGISFVGGNLISSVPGVQWYNTSGAIAGATAQQYRPLDSGFYYAVASDSNGCSSGASNVLHLTSEMVGVSSMGFAEGMHVYPNPVRGQLSIDLGTAGSAWITIYSTTGQKVVNNAFLNKQVSRVDLSAYPAGVYFVMMRYGNGRTGTGSIVLEK